MVSTWVFRLLVLVPLCLLFGVLFHGFLAAFPSATDPAARARRRTLIEEKIERDRAKERPN
jgi:hypothetical protein